MFVICCRWLMALILVGCAYAATRLPRLSFPARAELVAIFEFHETELPYDGANQIRPVHPDLAGIASWISSVGAAISIADLDNDSLSNDICFVDTSNDQVRVLSTANNYSPFDLLDPLPKVIAPTGCLTGDLNEDGTIDVLVYFWGRPPIAYLQRPGGEFGKARFVPVDLLPNEDQHRMYTNAATRTDVDGDGHVDIILGNYFQDQANILDPAAADDQQMHHSMSRSFNGGTNRVLLWTGGTSGSSPSVSFRQVDGLFDEHTARAWTLAVAAADLDDDLLPEIYFANDFGPDVLLHNRSQPGQPRFEKLYGQKEFTSPNSKVLGRDSFKGMGADFGDVNGDGRLDIYVSNIASEFALEESHFLFLNTGKTELMSHGMAPFVERSEQLGLSRSGWGWESRLADFNNDGIPEAIQATGFVKGTRNRWAQLHEAAMGNDNLLRYPAFWHRVRPGDDLSGHDPNAFFVKASDGRFYDLATEVGLGKPQVTRGIAVSDVDADGDLDLAFGNQWEPSRFYRNDCRAAGAYLQLRLRLPVAAEERTQLAVEHGLRATGIPTCPAIGAQAVLTLADGKKLVAQVDGGNGHSGTRSPELHFGLGQIDDQQILDVRIQWRALNGTIHETNRQFTPGSYTLVLAAEKMTNP